VTSTGTISAQRRAHISAATLETQIEVSLDLDGGAVTARTGVRFLDHMLDALGRHGKLGIDVSCTGDAAMDPHHTVEDVGIALGRGSVRRLASVAVSRAMVTPMPHWMRRWRGSSSIARDVPISILKQIMPEPVIGRDFASSLVEEFWRAFIVNAGLTAHIDLIRGRNAHHAAEAIFKAGALALHAATRNAGDQSAIPSTKGILA
jgi:imidazoleglycerol-phosphate dehydratase